MDRLSFLRLGWMVPLIAASAALVLWPLVRHAAPDAARSTGAPLVSAALASSDESHWTLPGTCSTATVRCEATPWLPPLEPRSRAILTSYAPVGQPSASTPQQSMPEPLLVPAQSRRPDEPGPQPAGAPTTPGVVVPEPERLPGGMVETGEPIPPRLPQSFGQSVPAPELATTPQPEKQPDSEPWRPKVAAGAGSPKSGGEAPRVVASPNVLPMPTGGSVPRSHNLELIATESDGRTRHAFDLAGRGAFLSARAEFIAALRMLSQGLDAEEQTSRHSQTLAVGLTAKEAGEFVPDGMNLEADLDLAGIIGRHRTPVLKGADPSTLTSVTALQCYLTFAQEQLAAAAGREVAGSMALRGLGKLYETMGEKKVPNVQAAKPKAMVFYQSSLLVCPQNFLASNDLGVLLARSGRLDDARIALEHSLLIAQQPAGWRNLAVVYQQLGNVDAARRAQQRFESLQKADAAQQAGTLTSQQVRWIDSHTFAQMNPEQPNAQAPGVVLQPGAKQSLSQDAKTEGQRVAKSPLQNHSAPR